MLPDATQRLRMIAVLALILTPHVIHFPIWLSLLAAGVLGWQALVALRGWPQPGRLVRLTLAIAAFIGVYLNFGHVDGRDAGVALLALLLTLKLTEIRTHRDIMVLLSLCFFLLITHFLFSQAIGMVLFLAVGAILIIACFIDASHPQGALPVRALLIKSVRLLAQALPIAALLFMFFPRIPGSLWGLPSEHGSVARAGLSDSMSPGAISQVALSDDVAFRVRFKDQPPPPSKRYWRGPVFWAFDGQQWTRGQPQRFMDQKPERTVSGQPVTYQLTMQPSHHNWLLALDLPSSVPQDTHMDAAGTLRTKDPIDKLSSYQLTSFTDYRLQASAPKALRAYAQQLPHLGNPRARELAAKWAKQYKPREVVAVALQRFSKQDYVYTLKPKPVSGPNHIDEFLFQTQEGFCALYAGAFTFLMRAAGIPARVVTGYQGGQSSLGEDYMVVRAANAHAWSEVWLKGRGWVRFDPTAVVSPSRVDSGLAASMGKDEPVPYMIRGTGDLLYKIAMTWDYVNAAWNRWFLAYGPKLQNNFMQYLGLPNTRAMLLALTFLTTAFLALLGYTLTRQTRPPKPTDPVQAAWLNLCRKMAKAGIPKEPSEGPLDYAERVAYTYKGEGHKFRQLARHYARLHYRNGSNIERERFVRDARRYRMPRHAIRKGKHH